MLISNFYRPLLNYPNSQSKTKHEVLTRDDFIYSKEYYEDSQIDNTDIKIDLYGKVYHTKNIEY